MSQLEMHQLFFFIQPNTTESEKNHSGSFWFNQPESILMQLTQMRERLIKTGWVGVDRFKEKVRLIKGKKQR